MELLDNIYYIGHGVVMTMQLLIGSLSIGIPLAILCSIIRYKGMAVWFIENIVSVIRGTPLILQLSLVYFTFPTLLGVKLSILAAGIITLGLNSTAYLSEIIRSGINSIPKGQFEATQSLGISEYYMWKDIILPQVVKNILPAIVNEVVCLLKETALIATIGGMDIMRYSQILAADQFNYFMPLIIAGLYYYSLVLIIEFLGKKIEVKKIC